MGAADFTTIALGKTAREAFNAAHDEALYWHGHGGYSGSIAEKGSFVEFGTVKGLSATAFLRHFHKVENARYLTAADTERLRKKCGGWNDAYYRAEERLADERVAEACRKVPKSLQGIITPRMVAVADDKWGPAACVEIAGTAAKEIKEKHGRKGTHDRVFVFFGLASC